LSSIVIQGDTSGSITVEAPSVAGTHTLTLPKATGNIATDATVGLGTKNRIINGGMVIDQRNGGASVTATNGGYTLDRWYTASTSSSKFTVDQDTDAPTGFSHSVKLTSSAATTPGSTDQYFYAQNIEGFNWADISYGTANAKTVTLSFWVKSSLTGTFGGSIQNSGYNYSYPFSYSISSANTWEQKSVTITGATAGTWIGATNGVGARLYFSLGNGSTYLGTANTWAGSQYNSVTGETQVIGTSGATFYITGVQLEVGENATPFENRMYGTELALCQRYYWRIDDTGTYPAFGSGFIGSSTQGLIYINHPVPMRASATYSYSGTLYISDSADHTVSSIINTYWSPTSSMVRFGISGATTGNGAIAYLEATGTNYFEMSSEL
jgi:hypothetical protein